MDLNHNFIRTTYSKYLITSMLAILGSVVGQMGNNILVGNLLGVEALSVPGITLPIHYIFATLGALFGIGGMALCAQLTGKNKPHRLREAFTLVYVLISVTALVLSVLLMLNLDRVVTLLGTAPEMVSEVRQYAAVTILCGVFNMGVYPAFHLLRLDGRTWLAVLVFAAMAVVTVGLDVLLISVLHMGVLGAALAYGGGLFAASVLGVLLLTLKGRTFRWTRLSAYSLKLVGRLFRIGSPSAMENLCILLKVFVLNLMLSGFGVAALSAFNVVNSLTSFAFIFIAGVSGSIMPFAGVLYTEKDIASLKQLLKIAFMRGLAMSSGFTFVCIVFAAPISGFFGITGAQALSFSVPAVICFSVGLIPFMINSILICLYQCTGRALEANVLTALRGFLFVVSFALLLLKPLGAFGVWHSFWIGDLAALLVAAAWAYLSRRKNLSLSRLTLLDEQVEAEGKFLAFSVAANRASIAKCAETITEFCENNELSMKRTTAISLAIEEFLLLILEKNEKDPNFSVRILVLHEVAVLRIRDSGVVFDPVEYYEEANAAGAEGLTMLEDMQDTLGIKLVLGMADTVNYQQTFGANNLTIVL